MVEGKLSPPTPRAGTIERTRLLEPLRTGTHARVVVIVGPPGSGKTTLMAQWAAAEQRPVVWLTLDDLDNDPAILLTYLVVAFDRIAPMPGSMRRAIGASRAGVLGSVVPRLVAELHGWQRPAVIILDDLHRLRDQGSLDILTALCDHLPRGFQLVLAGRTAPRLPLGRLRAEGALLELDERDLACDESDARAFAAAAGRALSPEDARRLVSQSEGWTVAIQLATMARSQGREEPGSMLGVSGREQYIFEYLQSEFERDFDADELTCLTRTAVAESITPDLAAVVADVGDARRTLRAAARKSLLVQEVKGSVETYRYHNLLRDFLLAELERREPGGAGAAHLRASAWFDANGSVDLALEHALAGGDPDAAARIVTRVALPMFFGGMGLTLDRWLERFAADAFSRRPSLAVIAGWIHLMSGRDAAR